MFCVGVCIPRTVGFLVEGTPYLWIDLVFCVLGIAALLVSCQADDELARLR